MRITYRQVTDPEIGARVRARFATRIEALQALGFRELAVYSETTPAFGLLTSFPAVFFESYEVHGLLRLTLHEVVMASWEHVTYALPMGLGCKFCTRYADGSALISANFQGGIPPVDDEAAGFHRFTRKCSIQSAWRFHRAMTAAFAEEGKQPDRALSFESYVKIGTWEDTYPYHTAWLYTPAGRRRV